MMADCPREGCDHRTDRRALEIHLVNDHKLPWKDEAAPREGRKVEL